MRISDWSSDVCSSDLFYRPLNLRALVPPVSYRDIPASESALILHSCWRGALSGNMRPAITRFNGTISQCLIFLQCSRRSEEHTSELQSLMRISYAVFCLKKKKTNK